MRFAYIDSQGKEVAIPGADALRLRIELGAIVEDTMFFDSSTGRWAPAAEHEIYRTLKREIDGGDEGGGFAAPPPTFGGGASAPPAADSARSKPEPKPESASQPDPETPDDEGASIDAPAADVPVDPGADAGEVAAREADSDFGDFGNLDLAPMAAGTDDADEPEVETPPPPAADAEDDDLDFDLGSLTVADDDLDDDDLDDDLDDGEDPAGYEESANDAPAPAGAPESGGKAPDFDMGSFGALDLEDEDGGGTEDAAPASWDLSSEFDGPSASDFEEAPTGDAGDHDTPDFSGGLTLEDDAGNEDDPSPSWLADDTPGAADPQSIDGLDEATGGGDDFAGWQDADPVDEPSRSGASASDDSGSDDDDGERKPRRTAPQRRVTPAKSGGAGQFVVLLLVVAVLGAGGWFVFQSFSGGAVPEEEELALPPLPENLEPQLRQLAARASATMVENMRTLPQREAIPPEAPQDWLLGVYYANASDYPEVVDYWNAYAALLREVRARDTEFFESAFEAEVVAANVSETNAELLTARAFAGFEAAERDRRLVYDQLQAVIDASLDLHGFLVQNEENIDHDPASAGISRDPVLEAVPVTEALKDELWDRVADITGALDELGYLDQVRTEALLDVFFEKLAVTGIR